MPTWNSLIPLSNTGVRVSNPQQFGVVGSVKTLTPSLSTLTPEGSTCIVEWCYALDGTNYTAWEPIISGVAVAPLAGDLTTASRFKVRVTLSTTNVTAIPVFIGASFYIEPLLKTSGTWVSPQVGPIDFFAQGPLATVIRKAGSVAGDVTKHVRYKVSADTSWSDWVLFTSPVPHQYPYMQYKLTLTPSADRLTSPEVLKLTLASDYVTKSGHWITPPIDMSQASSYSNSKVTMDVAFGTAGTISVYSRSRASETAPWSDWCTRLPDGLLMHPANPVVQIAVLITGTVELKSMLLLADGSAEAKELMTGLTPMAEYDFTTLRDTLIIVNGADFPYKWDAVTTVPAVLGGVPPALSMIETHQNRVWGVEVENPSRVRCSDILNPENWPAFNYFDFNPEDGDRITAIGRYGQNLMVSKQRSMAMVTGNSFSNYSITWMDFTYGATGPRAMCATDKYLAYVAVDGVRFTDLVTSIPATERMKPDWEQLNMRRLNQAAMVFYRNLLLVALPSKNSLVNDVVFVYDSLRNAWAIYKGWYVSAWTTYQEFGDVVLLAADSLTGQVYQTFVSDTDSGQVIQYRWRTREMTFNNPERYKLFRNIFIDVEGLDASSVLHVRMYVDGSSTHTGGTLTYNLQAGEQKSIHIMPPVHDVILGRTLTLEFEGTALLKSYVIEYSIKGTIPQEDV